MRELYRVGRIAGLDIGERRIGVAVSDATGTLARPVGVVQTTGLEKDALDRAAAKISRLAQEEDGLVALVIGLPRRLDGSANAMTPRVQAFARTLGDRTSAGRPSGRAVDQHRSREPVGDSGEGLATAKLGSTPRLRQSSCRTISIAGREETSPSLLVIVVLVAGSAAAFAFYMVNRIQEPYKGFSEPEKFVEIPSGTGAAKSGGVWSRPGSSRTSSHFARL